MSETALPTLNQNLNKGHSSQCLRLNALNYEDLSEKIQETRAALSGMLESIMEKDIKLASLLEKTLSFEHLHNETLIGLASTIQQSILLSTLSPQEKQEIWRPIATCYAEVQASLNKKIIPLEERVPIEVGGKFVINHNELGRFSFDRSSPPYINPPKFKFALKLPSSCATHGWVLDPFDYALMDLSYIESLSPQFREKFYALRNEERDIPLVLISADYGAIPGVRFDEEAIMAMEV